MHIIIIAKIDSWTLGKFPHMQSRPTSSLDSRRLGAGDSKNYLFFFFFFFPFFFFFFIFLFFFFLFFFFPFFFFFSFSFFFFFFFFFLLILNQEKYHQQFAVSPSLCRAGKTYYFPAIFERFQLVSVAKNTMLLNGSPLLSRNTVGSRFIPVPDSFLLP